MTSKFHPEFFHPYGTFESNMCPQKIILNLGVRTANKMKLGMGFEARSQNTRIVKTISGLISSLEWKKIIYSLDIFLTA